MRNNWIVVALAGAATLALPGCETGEARVAPSETEEFGRALPVEVAMPTIADLYATYRATASLGADREALIPSRVAGEVVEILVEEGDAVTAGQPLARLDGERLRLEMLAAKARFEMTAREHARSQRLRERGLISAAAAEALAFDLDALEAAYDLKRLEYEYTTLRATIPGVISRRHIKLGWRLEAGEPAFSIANTDRLVAELYIPQNDLGKIAEGQDARITVDAVPGVDFHATIDRVSPTINAADGSFRATVYIDNAQGLLAPGMFGRFSIAFEKHAGALAVPTGAILHEDNEDVVYVVEDGAASRRSVHTGIESGGMTEILDGIDAGEPVVITGHTSLRDGARVLAGNAPGIAG
ncbi:MAG TPA: efflux RND transporter periplasmic adaptor subunit [Woeseiaceae bacterium]|nr:efflux RND transporter periplasmic adaptor subunit [Woeseiaceae bacterium]